MKSLFALTLSLAALAACLEAAEHPRILVRASDRDAILEKIAGAEWMLSSYEELKAEVDPYADRHVEDPEWLLSRMLMHWGQHYTRFPIDPDTSRYDTRLDLENRSGNAPVPTVRVSVGSVEPLLSDGSFAEVPEIADFPVYHAEDKFRVESTKIPGLHEEVYLGNKVHWWNRKISDLGAQAGTLYFLTGEEKYAALAADVFMQWALGVYFQDAYNYPPTQDVYAGFFGGQDLTDYNYKTMAISYDYAYDYLVAHQADYLGALQSAGYLEGQTISSIADVVFTKFLEQGTFRNALVHKREAPNNHSMKQSELIWFALAIDDSETRERCMSVFLQENPQFRQPGGIWGDLWMGQYPWDDFFDNAIEAETGLWKEPPGYHQFPIRGAVRAAAAMDVNGYHPWTDYPNLLKATYAQFRFAFPDGTIAQFGDSTPAKYPDAVSLEFALAGARRNGLPEADVIAAYLGRMIDRGQYTRKADYKQLVYFEADLGPRADLDETRARTDTIPFASLFLQRVRGNDPENGLMLQVNGGRYIHDQRKGIDMEIYGPGRVVGSHSGTQYPFMRKEMAEFFVRAGAANTVVPAAEDLEDYEPMKLIAMEPMPGEEAVAPLFSFSEVSFVYNETAQRRVNAIIALPGEGGFYLDLFRSDHPLFNDYLYHNVGSKVTLTDAAGRPFKTVGTALFSDKPPGYQYYTNKQATLTQYDIVATFAGLSHDGQAVQTRVYVPWNSKRITLIGNSPYWYEAPGESAGSDETVRSTLALRQDGNSWVKPFVLIFEPTRLGRHKVRGATQNAIEGGATQVVEVLTDDLVFTIFSSLDPSLQSTHEGMDFQGRFGIICRRTSDQGLVALYLGDGQLIGVGDEMLAPMEGETAAYRSFGADWAN